ncbi:MAG: hypothetical protein QOF58_6549 [Pseudonocardiales bacterium]|jgi:hypothetical protein|nr:hypothetical protein [Pseudonocardiales bacterium]
MAEQILRLVDSIHLDPADDGTATAVDDRTLTAFHLNRTAYLVTDALRSPRTAEQLASVLAAAVGCATEKASAPVAVLLAELGKLGWIGPASR